MDAVTRSIIGYQVSDNCGIRLCILAMLMAFQGLTKLIENFKFISVGAIAHIPLETMQFAKKYVKAFIFKITIEWINRTYKISYHHTRGFERIDSVSYYIVLRCAYNNFLRPHKHNKYKIFDEVALLQWADNTPNMSACEDMLGKPIDIKLPYYPAYQKRETVLLYCLLARTGSSST